jgi:hypothetical protein
VHGQGGKSVQFAREPSSVLVLVTGKNQDFVRVALQVPYATRRSRLYGAGQMPKFWSILMAQPMSQTGSSSRQRMGGGGALAMRDPASEDKEISAGDNLRGKCDQ